LALFVCADRAQATEISGTITSTLTISDDSQLVGDVTCAVPLALSGANPCIAFGVDHIKLRLNGHTITGPVVPPTGCSLPSDSKFGVGIYVNGQTDVKIQGPGVIQHFERWGILLLSSTEVTVRKVTANRNCWSGMQTISTSDSNFEEDIWINNAAGSNGAACGGICLLNSNKNRMRKSTFYGNGSVDYANGNVDFGIGFEGSSSENRVEENDIGGNTNGVFFFNTSSDNVVRRNIIVGNPAAQVIKTFVLVNQQGADIAFRPNFTGANNTFRDNFCVTYIQGAGPAAAPCPNIRTEGVEEAASRSTGPLKGEKGSNGPRTAPSRFQIASAIASFLAVALGMGLRYALVTV
jgi:parallel beta-helix repeat protein